MAQQDKWMRVPSRPMFQGNEPFTNGPDATVMDFWRFAMSDLRMNNVRGYLAEYLVARAVGATHPRVEWDSCDVITPEGLRIEVKGGGYLQAWEQRALSTIVFSGLSSRRWSPKSGYAAEATYNADVYVFCLQTADQHDRYDPLDVSQWAFYVLPAHILHSRGLRSIGLSRLEATHGPAMQYVELPAAVASAGNDAPTGVAAE